MKQKMNSTISLWTRPVLSYNMPSSGCDLTKQEIMDQIRASKGSYSAYVEESKVHPSGIREICVLSITFLVVGIVTTFYTYTNEDYEIV